MIKVKNKLVEEEISIVINKDIETVFEFFCDLRNDKFWRKEINFTTADKIELGAVAVENSYLSKKVSNYTSKLICCEYMKNERITYETLPDYFFLRSNRAVEFVTANATKITYKLAFDKAIVKHGLGFDLPHFLVSLVAKSDMKKYIHRLKKIVETHK